MRRLENRTFHRAASRRGAMKHGAMKCDKSGRFYRADRAGLYKSGGRRDDNARCKPTDNQHQLPVENLPARKDTMKSFPIVTPYVNRSLENLTTSYRRTDDGTPVRCSISVVQLNTLGDAALTIMNWASNDGEIIEAIEVTLLPSQVRELIDRLEMTQEH